MSIWLYVILALWPPALQYQLSVLLFVCVLFLLLVIVMSGEPKQNHGRGLVDRKLVQDPSPPPPHPAALLVCYFGDFRCGMLLFMIILVIYKYKNR